MKKILISFIVSAILISACSKEKEYDKTKMAHLYVDILIAGESYKHDIDSLKIVTDSLYSYYQISDEEYKRGIEKLQKIYALGNTEGFIGDALECLSIIHNVSIPELPDIYKKREEEEKRRKRESEEFEEIFQDIGNIKNRGNIIPFKREVPKTGRNEPCPCGSGKKYKKCCLNKS